MAVAVAQGGRIIWEEGFGWANRDAGLKATAHTPFSLASITKPFTTTTLMTLVAEGKLSLDESANKYLRKSKIVGPNGNPDGATLRRLGGHAGGLPSMFEHFFRNESAQAPNAETLLHEYGRLAYPAGSCYEYGNIGYVALGAVASNVTGMDTLRSHPRPNFLASGKANLIMEVRRCGRGWKSSQATLRL